MSKSKRYVFSGKGVLAVKVGDQKKVTLFDSDEPLPTETPPEVIKAGLAAGTITEWPEETEAGSPPADPSDKTPLHLAQDEVTATQKELVKQQDRLENADTPTKIKNAEAAVEKAQTVHDAALEAYKAAQDDEGDD